MSVRRLLFPSLMIVALLAVVPLVADETVRCESKGDRRVCRADNIGSVVLLEQLSFSDCEKGESWGYTRDAIWVDHGCRADFKVLTRRRGRDDDDDRNSDREYRRDADRVICESDGDRHLCPADLSDGVRIARTFGDRECIEGRSWGCGERGIWVDRGCRAEFILGRERQRRRASRTEVVRCESKGDQRRFCRIDALDRVELKKQLSISDCKFDETWGYTRDGIWVTGGCRADFLVQFR